MSTVGLPRRSASLTDLDWPSRSAARAGAGSPTLSVPTFGRGGSSAVTIAASITAATAEAARDIRLLSFDERLRFDDRVLVREGVEGRDEQTAGPRLDGHEPERGQGQAVVGLE